jgi:hypothetical protein
MLATAYNDTADVVYTDAAVRYSIHNLYKQVTLATDLCVYTDVAFRHT